eukprot:COSAG01_NODE_6011_length_3902_cov_10.567447_7_plen_177_part_00
MRAHLCAAAVAVTAALQSAGASNHRYNLNNNTYNLNNNTYNLNNGTDNLNNGTVTVTGMCTGNTDPAENVICPGFYSNKGPLKAGITPFPARPPTPKSLAASFLSAVRAHHRHRHHGVLHGGNVHRRHSERRREGRGLRRLLLCVSGVVHRSHSERRREGRGLRRLLLCMSGVSRV